MVIDGGLARGPGAARRQLPEEVAAYVRELIISGDVRPGEFLRMERIAEALAVSNTPVREGLLSLRSEGFVELVPRRGFVVAPFGRRDVRDLFWAQAQLAGELAARAAKIVTPAQIAALEANIEDYEKAVAAGDRDRVADLGHRFHRQINLAANSRRLALLLGTVVSQLPSRFYAQIEGNVANAREAHPLILEAIRKRASRKAQALTAEHILQGGEQLIGMLEERGLWSDEPAS